MFLKSLKIQGFKSFPDKTVLEFKPGITAVVGPNGSGKSNISDAVSWVLGEQSAKSLRGGKMEDVIFNGTQRRKAMGFAKVDILIDNADNILDVDSKEVVVSRKYYRSGESKYSINGNAVRLRDVQELLMDTGLGRDGYAVIGQGKIAEIVSAKSQDRREIFEEAAGISKYRFRKIKTERQLEYAKENLVRLNDILAEIESRIEPLKKQADKAKKFLNWSNEEKTLEISLNLHDLGVAKIELKEYEDKLMILLIDFKKIEIEIDDLEKNMANIYEEINICSIELDDIRKEKENIEKMISTQKSRVAVFENDIFHKKEAIKKLTEEINNSKKDNTSFDEEICEKEKIKSEQEKLIIELKEKKDKIQRDLKDAVATKSLHEEEKEKMSLDIQNIIREISLHKIKENTTENSIENIISNKNNAKNSTDMLEKQIEAITKDIKNSAEYEEVLFNKKSENETQLTNHKENLNKNKKSYDELSQEFEKLQNDILKKENRVYLLKDLENSLEDFTYSVKTVMQAKKKGELFGIHAPISNVISVSQKYVLAIETTLSFGIQNIIVDDENSAKQAIKMLSDKKAGRATFLPLTSVKGYKLEGNDFLNNEGFQGLASDLVKYDEKYYNIINQLLGRVVICDNIENAINMAKKHKFRFRFVTLDGQVINQGGSLTGGSKAKTSGILSRKNEVLSLNSEITFLKKKEVEKSDIIEKFSLEYANLEKIYKKTEEKIFEIDDDRKENNYYLNSLNTSLSEKKKLFEENKNYLNEFNLKVKDMMIERDNAESKIKFLTQSLIVKEKDLEKVYGLDIKLEDEKENLSDKALKLQMEMMEIEKELALVNQSIAELNLKRTSSEKRNEEIVFEVKKTYDEIENIKNLIETSTKDAKYAKEKVVLLDTNAKNILEKRNKLDFSNSDLRKKEKEILVDKEELSKEKIRLEERKNNKQEKYDKIISALWDEYELTVVMAKENAEDLEDINAAKTRLKSLKSQIRLLGSVNVESVEEFKEVSARYEFLKNQMEDVKNSKVKLENLINDLTKTMQEMFTKSFKEINEQFFIIFKELFGGGEASLSLSDSDNVLESGIEIDVQPPGKLIKNLASLSGGEKAFIAIAIYFAILTVKPAPFCLLDEIEAALDDVNVLKFASYLRNLTSNTQFIAISHRRGTMEEADVLYGVTMQEEGVSKLLQLNLSEVETNLNMKAK